MADEQRIKDAKIEVRLDTEAARKQLEGLRSGAGDRSVPGGRPPSPGRKDEKSEREGEKRRERAGVRPVVPVAGSAIVGLVKAAVGTVALSTVAEIVPAMIDARLKQMGDADFFTRAVLKSLEFAVGVPLNAIGKGIRAIEGALPVLGALTGSAIDVARSSKLLTGSTASPESIARIAKREAAIASIETGAAKARRAAGRAGLGAAVVDTADAIKDALFGAGTAK